MQGLNPEISFLPALKAAYPADQVIVVKDAKGGEPIRRWYRQWKPAEGSAPSPETNGDLYDRLMTKVAAEIEGRRLDSITFVWMQGERDAREKQSAVYAESLRGLITQLKTDLKREDMMVVIGRLSDFMANDPEWKKVRSSQEEVAASTSGAAWVDTDDLNGPKDDLHYTEEGYNILGERFAASAIELILQQEQGKPQITSPAPPR